MKDEVRNGTCLLQWSETDAERFWKAAYAYELEPSKAQRLTARHLVGVLRQRIIPPAQVLLIGDRDPFFAEVLIAAGYEAARADLGPWLQAARNDIETHERWLGSRQRVDEVPVDVVLAPGLLATLLDEEIDSFFCTVRAALKPDGHLVISTPTGEQLDQQFAICPSTGLMFHREQRLRSFSWDMLRPLLAANGLHAVAEFEIEASEAAFAQLGSGISRFATDTYAHVGAGDTLIVLARPDAAQHRHETDSSVALCGDGPCAERWLERRRRVAASVETPDAKLWSWTAERVSSFWSNISGTPLDKLSFGLNSGEALLRSVERWLVPDGRHLDVGAGEGHMAAMLAEAGYPVAVLEPAIGRTRTLTNRLKGQPGFLGLVESLDRLSERSFDVVFACEVVEHVLEDELADFFTLLASALKPGGRLILTTPNREDLNRSLVYSPTANVLFHRWQHVRSFDRVSFERLLAEHGFAVEVVHAIDLAAAQGGASPFFELIIGGNDPVTHGRGAGLLLIAHREGEVPRPARAPLSFDRRITQSDIYARKERPEILDETAVNSDVEASAEVEPVAVPADAASDPPSPETVEHSEADQDLEGNAVNSSIGEASVEVKPAAVAADVASDLPSPEMVEHTRADQNLEGNAVNSSIGEASVEVRPVAEPADTAPGPPSPEMVEHSRADQEGNAVNSSVGEASVEIKPVAVPADVAGDPLVSEIEERSRAEISPEQGHCVVSDPLDGVGAGDDASEPTRSTLRLFENGVELGPAHSAHEEIRTQGQGRFSHWEGSLFFSASDNTNPLTNGRRYVIIAEHTGTKPKPGPKARAPHSWLRPRALAYATMHKVVPALLPLARAMLPPFVKAKLTNGVARLEAAFAFEHRDAFATRAVPLAAFQPILPREMFAGGQVVLCNNALAWGGVERQVINTLRGVAKRSGRPPHLLCVRLGYDVDYDFYKGALEGFPGEVRNVIDVGMARERLRKFGADVETRLAATAGWMPSDVQDEILRFAGDFATLTPSVVHVWQDALSISAGYAARILGVPTIIVSSRNMAAWRFGYYRPFMADGYRELASCPELVMLNNSVAGAADYADWLGLSRDRYQIIRNGIDPGEIRPPTREETECLRGKIRLPAGATVVGSIFRFYAEKRPRLWIETAAKLAAELHDVHFVVFGTGPMKKEILDFARQCGFADRVHLPGTIENAALGLSTMDAFLLTSEFEGTPNVVLEASLMGVPVIATDAGGSRETIKEAETGFVVAPAEPEFLADKLRDVLGDQAWRSRVREVGPRFVHQYFGLDRMLDETLELYGLGGTPRAAG
jgi:glycosyltransferase involved in cell wall biosynthesis/2-polyprenyl-3-methyl-5-hydroxy-6-metoxy-1,4-benzoquinol methylase